MLGLQKSGVGLRLVRESIAEGEANARGIPLQEDVRFGCTLEFAAWARDGANRRSPAHGTPSGRSGR